MLILRTAAAILAAATAFLVGGCPDSGDSSILVRVFNNTDFDVDPGIEVGRSPGSLSFLDVGVLAPGEVVEVEIDCDDAFFLTATDSVQLGGSVEYVLDPLPIFELDFDYFCGEVVDFEFVGNGQQFDVLVDVGGEVLY